MTTPKTALTNTEWRAEGTRLFGDDIMQWRFRCVSCGNVARPADFEDLGAEGRRAPHECIGRVHLERGGLPDVEIDGNSRPCNWHAAGLIRLATLIEVESVNGTTSLAFPFDPKPVEGGAER